MKDKRNIIIKELLKIKVILKEMKKTRKRNLKNEKKVNLSRKFYFIPLCFLS